MEFKQVMKKSAEVIGETAMLVADKVTDKNFRDKVVGTNCAGGNRWNAACDGTFLWKYCFDSGCAINLDHCTARGFFN